MIMLEQSIEVNELLELLIHETLEDNDEVENNEDGSNEDESSTKKSGKSDMLCKFWNSKGGCKKGADKNNICNGQLLRKRRANKRARTLVVPSFVELTGVV